MPTTGEYLTLRRIGIGLFVVFLILTVAELTNATLAERARQREATFRELQAQYDMDFYDSLKEIADAKESAKLEIRKQRLQKELHAADPSLR